MNRTKIRPPRRLRLGDAAASDFGTLWAVLADAFRQIQRKNITLLSYEQLHRKAYTLVIQKQGAKLYDSVSELVGLHLDERRSAILAEAANDRELFVRLVLREWDEHLQAMRYISDILMYLNRNYVAEHKRLMVYDMGIQLFKHHVVEANDHEVGARLVETAMDEIALARNGQVITLTTAITRTIAMMEMLVQTTGLDLAYGDDSYYTQRFEPEFLQRLTLFFEQLVAKHAARGNGGVYVAEVLKFIAEEESRVHFYLPPKTLDKLRELMNNVLIRDHIDAQLSLPGGMADHLDPIFAEVVAEVGTGAGFAGAGSTGTTGAGSTSSTGAAFAGTGTTDAMDVDSVDYHFFEVLYQLFGRVSADYARLCTRLQGAIGELGARLDEYVRERAGADGKKALLSAYALRWVDAVLALREALLRLWQRSFARNPVLEQAISTGVREVVNGKAKRLVLPAAETLSVYMDWHIKQVQKLAGGDPTALLDRASTFLAFVRDRDAFEVNYANHFAKRFLNAKQGLGASTIEETVLARLAEELGALLLDKVMRMNNDIAACRDLNAEWRRQHPTSELEVKICNAQDWPLSMTKDYLNDAVIWPTQLRPVLRQFEEFWRGGGHRNENKLLHWSARFGLVDLRITYPLRTYDITLAPAAAVVMMLFAPQSSNDDGSPVLAFAQNRRLTYTEIQELTGLPDSELRRHLQLVAVAPRLRLLVKTPMSKEVHNDDVFSLNPGFKSPLVKVKVLTVSASSLAKKEASEVDATIKEGRKFAVNAAIVRLMKLRRLATHNELLAEVVRILTSRFKPLVGVVKTQIDELIQNDYIRRDDDDRNLYHYIA